MNTVVLFKKSRLYYNSSYQQMRIKQQNSDSLHIFKTTFNEQNRLENKPLAAFFSPNSPTYHFRQKQISKKQQMDQQILCKIVFEIDGKEEAILIYENSTLQIIANKLIDKIKLSYLINGEDEPQISIEEANLLKKQIKNKLESILIQSKSQVLKTDSWRNKMRSIINQEIYQDTDCFTSPLPKAVCNSERRSLNYFGYSACKNENGIQISVQSKKYKENYEKIKFITEEVNKKCQSSKKTKIKTVPLYQRYVQITEVKNQQIKQHQRLCQKQILSQCTFHPLTNDIKVSETESSKDLNQSSHSKSCVFNRLYNVAIEKHQKKKQIQQEIMNRQLEKQRSLTFIPKINGCSRQIIKQKKQFQKMKINQKLNENSQYTQKSVQKPVKLKKTFSKQRLKTISSNRLQNQNKVVFQIYEEALKSKRINTCHSQSNLLLQKSKFGKTKNEIIRRNVEQMKANAFRKRKNNKENQNSTVVNSKKIKRQKIIISDEETRSTQDLRKSLLIPQKSHQSMIDNVILDDKQFYMQNKNVMIDPFTFFYGKKQKEIADKDSFNLIKHQTKSQQLYNKRKDTIFENIFYFLTNNPNHDGKNLGQITAQNIYDNKKIPLNLIQIFYPMAEQMSQLKVGLDKDEFIWSIGRIFQRLSTNEKGNLLAWGIKIQPSQFKNTIY